MLQNRVLMYEDGIAALKCLHIKRPGELHILHDTEVGAPAYAAETYLSDVQRLEAVATHKVEALAFHVEAHRIELPEVNDTSSPERPAAASVAILSDIHISSRVEEVAHEKGVKDRIELHPHVRSDRAQAPRSDVLQRLIVDDGEFLPNRHDARHGKACDDSIVRHVDVATNLAYWVTYRLVVPVDANASDQHDRQGCLQRLHAL
mmetsp:Transcript_2744/g.11001  ORF Transcript_2744/g.11001 Transcript_2744/m.11001 type:complete len:205 (-) Transcript_2744:707-1321(-)